MAPRAVKPRRALILGAAGRDFHDFNTFFRDNPEIRVVAFTATQIPFIADRVYPPELAGPQYPEGIPIYREERMAELIRELGVTDVYFSYSDVSHEHVMHLASIALAHGCSFHLLGPDDMSLVASKPVLAVTASRTGAGKSTIARKLVSILKGWGVKPVVIRHPMPYGLLRRKPFLFRNLDDLRSYQATVEELEEFEGHIKQGVTVLAGVDYQEVLLEAEKEGDVIVWDGGNNDLPFYRSQVYITVVDPMRPGHESKYHPGEANVRRADIIVVNKVNISDPRNVQKVQSSVRRLNPDAIIVHTRSEAVLEDPDLVRGRRVLVIEDGPTVTHGELAEGAGAAASRALGATLVDPRPFAVGSIKEAYEKFPSIGPVLPALGYSRKQLTELEETVNAVECDAVVLGTPADLTRLIDIRRPVTRVSFEAVEVGSPTLEEAVRQVLTRRGVVLNHER
jgi:predicted GTPase